MQNNLSPYLSRRRNHHGPGVIHRYIWRRIHALTIVGGEYLCNEFSLRLEGGGATINALDLKNPKGARFKNLRVNNFNGYGVKVQAGWDCLFETVSVELCGNSKEYAFSIVDGGDTSNMTHILRLQVERSKAKAIYVSPN